MRSLKKIIIIIIIIILKPLGPQYKKSLPKNIYNFTIRYLNNTLPNMSNMFMWGHSENKACPLCHPNKPWVTWLQAARVLLTKGDTHGDMTPSSVTSQIHCLDSARMYTRIYHPLHPHVL